MVFGDGVPLLFLSQCVTEHCVGEGHGRTELLTLLWAGSGG